MPDISKITLPSGSSYDLKDKYRIHPVIGTQTKSTNVWTGEIDVDELYDGIAIAYFLPYAGTSTSATLTLTLSNGETTAPIAVYAKDTTRATTHYGAGSTIFLTFWSAGSISVSGTATTNDRWTSFDYNSDTTTNNRIAYFAGKTGAVGVWGVSLFMEDGLGTYQNICTGTRTVETTKTANTNGFRIGGSIFYTSTTYSANSNISGASVVYSAISLFDARYSFNVTRAAGQLTTYQPLYLKGTIHSDNLYYLDEVWWTQTPNEIGKVYVLVGGVYDSTTSNIRISLYEQNDWYIYNGSQLVAITCDARTVSGHTVETDVPEDAVFTDTTYSDGTGITIGSNNEINHSNSVTAQTTQKVYPIKIDAQGHISEYGASPTTLSGYGITDAKIASGTITLGSNTITPLTSSSTLDATKLSGTIPTSCYTDTKNTAGSTDTSSKIFLIGATSQTDSSQTFSQDTAYVGTDGCLYSGGSKVLTSGDGNNKVTQSASTTDTWRKVIIGYQNGSSGSEVTSTTEQVYATPNFECQPSTGTVKMTRTTIGNNATLEYNSTTQSLDFIFE